MKKIFITKGLPKWFLWYSYMSLIPILACPLVFFGTIFMFDNPDNFLVTFLHFLLINSYSVIYILLVNVGFNKFPSLQKNATIFPSINYLFTIIFIVFLFNQ